MIGMEPEIVAYEQVKKSHLSIQFQQKYWGEENKGRRDFFVNLPILESSFQINSHTQTQSIIHN